MRTGELDYAVSTPQFPGWYPDPQRPGRERLWDGKAWTDHLRKTADEGRFKPRTIVAAALAAAVGWVLLVVGVVAASVNDGVTANAPISPAPATSPPQQTMSPTPTPTPTPTSTPTPKAKPSPSPASVPAVVGLGLAEAKQKLRAADLEVGKVDRRPSSKKRGTVLKQGVPAGTKLEPGSRVPLVVACPIHRVPSVVGQSEASAIRELKSAGFRVRKTTQTRTTGTDGVVLSQSPSGGTRVKPNSVVRIVISDVQPAPDTDSTGNCTPGYSPCLPPASDYDCAGGSGDGPKYVDGPVRVTGSDPYDLDRDGDGVGCQS